LSASAEGEEGSTK